MPCGPMPLVSPGVLAYEARPSTIRDCRPHRSIFVTAPVAPMHAGPSPPTKHGPLPPRPASATNRSPRDPNARCRGLSSPDATTSTLVVAAAGCVTPSARSSTMMGRMRSARMTPPPGGYRCGDTLHSRSTGQTLTNPPSSRPMSRSSGERSDLLICLDAWSSVPTLLGNLPNDRSLGPARLEEEHGIPAITVRVPLPRRGSGCRARGGRTGRGVAGRRRRPRDRPRRRPARPGRLRDRGGQAGVPHGRGPRRHGPVRGRGRRRADRALGQGRPADRRLERPLPGGAWHRLRRPAPAGSLPDRGRWRGRPLTDVPGRDPPRPVPNARR